MAITIDVRPLNDRGTIGKRDAPMIPRSLDVNPEDWGQVFYSGDGFYFNEVTVRAIPNDRYAHVSYDGSKITVY